MFPKDGSEESTKSHSTGKQKSEKNISKSEK
jgi:hypothetical protein